MFRKLTLKNGLRIIAMPMKTTNAVSVLVMVKTGSEYEPKELNGVSHFLEHMVFKGTKRWPTVKVLAEAIERVGGEHNAFTDRNATGYWVKVPKKHFKLALSIVADMFLHAKIPPKEIERERKVILEELNMYRDVPQRHVADLFGRVMWGDQPAGRPVGGTAESVRGITRSDIVRYWNEHYTTQATIVCVAGAVGSLEVSSLARRLFRNAPTHLPPQKPKLIELQEKPAILAELRTTEQTHFIFGGRAFSSRDPRRFALALLADILGGMMSSRLFLRVRDTLGLAYYIRTFIDLDQDAGFIGTAAGVANDKAEEAMREIMKVYHGMMRVTVPKKELKKAKEHIKGQLLLGLETSDALAMFLGEQEAQVGTILSPAEVIKRVDAVSAKDIRDVARFVFQPGRLNFAAVGPAVNQKQVMKILQA